MGIDLSTEKPEHFAILNSPLTATGKIVKTSLGDFLELRTDKNELLLKKTIIFEGTKNSEILKKALRDLQLAELQKPSLNFIYIRSAQFFENQLYCSNSNAGLILDHFQTTLHDLVKSNLLLQILKRESDFWRLLISVARSLAFAEKHGFQGGFVHPKTLCYSTTKSEFCLMHPGFTNVSNLSLAKSGSMHFCSPELFMIVQKSDQESTINFPKSDFFSLGLVLVYLLSLRSVKVDFDKLYNRLGSNFEGTYLDRILTDLPDSWSPLLVRILREVTTEFDYLRISIPTFLDFFSKKEVQLIDGDFVGHAAVLEEYMFFKNSKIVEISVQNKERRKSRLENATEAH